jgi:hypothetical protein
MPNYAKCLEYEHTESRSFILQKSVFKIFNILYCTVLVFSLHKYIYKDFCYDMYSIKLYISIKKYRPFLQEKTPAYSQLSFLKDFTSVLYNNKYLMKPRLF